MVSSNFVLGTDNPEACSKWQFCSAFHPGGIIEQRPPAFSNYGINSRGAVAGNSIKFKQENPEWL